MKTEITYACGHKGTVNICGIKADRDRGVRWLEKYTLCPACKAAKRKKSIRKSIAKTTRMHLPRLKGNPEQIDQARIFLNRKLPWRIKKRYREFYKITVHRVRTPYPMPTDEREIEKEYPRYMALKEKHDKAQKEARAKMAETVE